ncbi:MAG: septation regulator SpoVG [Bdellovibrionaceae bacterium]|nr:septation regulator SpoVG [Pseudobdellovibrionaceae bacterium]
MNITDIKILLVNEERLKAYVSIIFDNCFIVKDLKIIQGPSNLFVAMPSKKLKDNSFKDIAHPLNKESRLAIEKLIFEEYKKTLQSINQSLDQITEEK